MCGEIYDSLRRNTNTLNRFNNILPKIKFASMNRLKDTRQWEIAHILSSFDPISASPLSVLSPTAASVYVVEYTIDMTNFSSTFISLFKRSTRSCTFSSLPKRAVEKYFSTINSALLEDQGMTFENTNAAIPDRLFCPVHILRSKR